MKGPRLRSRSCKVAWLASGMRLEHLEACLLGGCKGGDGCGTACGLQWLPGRHGKRWFSTIVESGGVRENGKRTNW